MELMVASLLITTMVIAVFSTIISTYRLTQPEMMISHDLGRQKLESLYEGIRGDWWTNTTTNDILDVVTDATEPTITLDNVVYTRTYTVAAVSNGNAKQYRRVTVNVSW